ncbi:MAG: portal protein [Nevskia sp.]|nr:portal protein [Nevskia sp.]
MRASVQELLRRAEQLENGRRVFDAHWQQVADYSLPSREFVRRQAPGAKRSVTLIFNTTAVLACEQLAGALHGMLTSPALRWFALRPRRPDLRDDDDARKWFDAVTELMYAHFTSPEVGFDTALHEIYLDLSGFGTGCMFMPDRGQGGCGYEARPLAECYVSEGADGRIDTLFRLYTLPAREVVRLWPETCPEAVQKIAEKTPDEPVKMMHATWPEEDSEGKRHWPSCYAVRDQKTQLEEQRFQDFPFAVPRWSKRSGEMYGNGPGMNALPDVKLVNKLEQVDLRSRAKLCDPVLVLPDDGFLTPLTLDPGSVIYARPGLNKDDRPYPLSTGGQPQLTEQKITQVEQRIKACYYTTWMNLPQQPNMTATEVLQRRDEMLRLMGPMIARVQSELLGPVIARTFAVMARNGLLPPLPDSLKSKDGKTEDYQVEYLSPLALAQRSSDAEQVQRWLGTMQPLIQADPQVLDKVDADAVAEFLAERNGVPARLMRDAASLTAYRQKRQQAADQQQQAASLQALATAAQRGAGAAQILNGMQQGAGGGAPAGGM